VSEFKKENNDTLVVRSFQNDELVVNIWMVFMKNKYYFRKIIGCCLESDIVVMM